MKSASVLGALLLIAGCSGVDPGGLRLAEGSRSVSLSAPYVYDEYYRVAGTTMVHTLAPGKYVARFEDDSGTYYDGPDQCFVITARFDTPEIAARNKAYEPKALRCGIYVPVKPDEMPKVYYYQADAAVPSDPQASTVKPPVGAERGTARQQRVGSAAGNAVVAAIIEAERKNLHFNRDQPKDDSLKRALSTR